MAAGLLCTNAAGRVLLVQPTYKPQWEIPGGAVEAEESPHQAALREAREELGVDMVPGRLLVVDWVPRREVRPEGVMFVYDGGELSEVATARFRLPPEELTGWAWCNPAQVRERTTATLALRVAAAVAARAQDATAYLEAGRPVG